MPGLDTMCQTDCVHKYAWTRYNVPNRLRPIIAADLPFNGPERLFHTGFVVVKHYISLKYTTTYAVF